MFLNTNLNYTRRLDMKRNLYGEKMLVIDLMLVSLWAFFFSPYCTPALLILIPMRLALSFEMYRKSPWTLVSAIGFMIAYSCTECLSKPFERMFYYFFCAVGEAKPMIEIFSPPLEDKMEGWIISISAIWYAWLVVLPIVRGIRLHNLKEIQWRKRWIWIYLLPLSVLCVWVMFAEGVVGGIMLGIVIGFLPLVYWGIYERKGRSSVQLILGDRRIMWYIYYAAFMLSVIMIGLKDGAYMKFVGLLLLPATFYIMLTKSMCLGTVLTRCCLALSLAGCLYCLTFDAKKWVAVVLMVVAVALIVFVGVTMLLKTHSWIASLILTIGVPVVIIPCILGLNPYICLDSEHTQMYRGNPSVRNGVYVVEKYTEIANNDVPNFWDTRYGLRDRYGVILPTEYDEFKVLGMWGRYIAVNKPIRYGCLKSDQRYGIFDLKRREFVVTPESIDVAQIEKIDDTTYKLINPEGRRFATLYLKGEYRGEYYHDAHIEPYFADGETSVEEFLGRAMTTDFDVDNEYWKTMRQLDPHTYRLVLQMMSLGMEESSPTNDLNYARAIREVINNDSQYKGNITKALDNVAQLSKTITDSGSQLDINTWSDYLRLIASTRTSLAYDTLMSALPENEWIDKEYVAWHNLTEAMTYYLDYLYSDETHLAVPEEKNTKIIQWLDFRRKAVEKEQDILVGQELYSIAREKLDSIKKASDFKAFFSHFHSYSNPDYYTPMWNEIKVAFDDWTFARTKLAQQLEPYQALSYTEYSKEVADGLFSFIEQLDKPGYRPVF